MKSVIEEKLENARDEVVGIARAWSRDIHGSSARLRDAVAQLDRLEGMRALDPPPSEPSRPPLVSDAIWAADIEKVIQLVERRATTLAKGIGDVHVMLTNLTGAEHKKVEQKLVDLASRLDALEHIPKTLANKFLQDQIDSLSKEVVNHTRHIEDSTHILNKREANHEHRIRALESSARDQGQKARGVTADFDAQGVRFRALEDAQEKIDARVDTLEIHAAHMGHVEENATNVVMERLTTLQNNMASGHTELRERIQDDRKATDAGFKAHSRAIGDLQVALECVATNNPIPNQGKRTPGTHYEVSIRDMLVDAFVNLNSGATDGPTYGEQADYLLGHFNITKTKP